MAKNAPERGQAVPPVKKYPRTVIFMVSATEDDAIRAEAIERGISISQVGRELVADGRKWRARKAKP